MFQSKQFHTWDADFRERMLDTAANPPDEICPFCGCLYEEGEFVHIDIGNYQQVTPSHCWECGAYELGCYDLDPEKQTYFRGWVRERQRGDETKYPTPPSMMLKREDEGKYFQALAEADNVPQPRSKGQVQDEDDDDVEEFFRKLAEAE